MKTKFIEIEGEIIQALSNGMFRVRLNNGFLVIAYLSGKIRKNFIRIILGDKVLVQISPYDLKKGRIIKRFI